MPTDDQIEEIQKRVERVRDPSNTLKLAEAAILINEDIPWLLERDHQQRERIATLEQTIKREGIEAQERTNRMTSNMLELTAEVESLRAQLAEKESRIHELTEQLDTLNGYM